MVTSYGLATAPMPRMGEPSIVCRVQNDLRPVVWSWAEEDVCAAAEGGVSGGPSHPPPPYATQGVGGVNAIGGSLAMVSQYTPEGEIIGDVLKTCQTLAIPRRPEKRFLPNWNSVLTLWIKLSG